MVNVQDFDNAVLLIDKPTGITSNEALTLLKRKTGIQRIGHSGTLDKFAGGLLVVATGFATKLLKYFLECEKGYEADIQLGLTTDTLDPEGKVIAEKPVPVITDEKLASARQHFLGVQWQDPPVFSALKINGKRASDLVRSGVNVELSRREISITDISIEKGDSDPSLLHVFLSCSRGTYVRSFARDLAEFFGTVGFLKKLRRTKVGPFRIEEAIEPDNIARNHFLNPAGRRFLLSPYDAMRSFGIVKLNPQGMKKAKNGAFISRNDIVSIDHGQDARYIVTDDSKKLVAIVELDFSKWSLRYLNVFAEPI